MLEYLRVQLVQLRERRAALRAELDGVISGARSASRDLTDDEKARLAAGTEQLRKLNGDEDGLNSQIREAEETEHREQVAAGARAESGQVGERRTGGAVVTSEPQVYGNGSGNSYFHDLAKAQLRADSDAAARLQRHAAELRVELPARERRREERAQREMDGMGTAERWHEEQRSHVFEKRVNPNRTDGQGGYFVPPLWLIDQYIDLPRFGRPIANAVRNMALPGGTDSVNLPKVATGTSTGAQTADGAPVTSTDMTDTSVSATVYTVAGQQDASMQLLDQSPAPGFDAIIFADLLADLAVRQDVYVINGSGTAGQPTGILNVSSPNAITYTDASPTLPEMYVPWVQSVSQIFTNRKRPATATFALPKIWYWATAGLDTTGRPLIQPSQDAPFNPMALQTGEIAEGPVGKLTVGTPVILDGNIPENLGAGTDETRIITLRTSDLYLWEGAIQTRVLTEVLSGTLQVRFQVYRYAAFMGNRLPKAISIVSGTGMIPTSGY